MQGLHAISGDSGLQTAKKLLINRVGIAGCVQKLLINRVGIAGFPSDLRLIEWGDRTHPSLLLAAVSPRWYPALAEGHTLARALEPDSPQNRLVAPSNCTPPRWPEVKPRLSVSPNLGNT